MTHARIFKHTGKEVLKEKKLIKYPPINLKLVYDIRFKFQDRRVAEVIKQEMQFLDVNENLKICWGNHDRKMPTLSR